MKIELCSIDWGNVAQWVGAVGSIVVAILAIWGERIRTLLCLGPKLILELHDPMGERVPIQNNSQVVGCGRWYHLRVSNKHKWTKAANVRIVIIELTKPAADGNFIRQPLSGPLQLMWRFSHFHTLFSNVGPDDYCDLGSIYQNGDFTLTPFVFPGNFEGTLKANQKMRVMVQAHADNAESEPLSIEISWDGIWKDGDLEMSQHLVVKKM